MDYHLFITTHSQKIKLLTLVFTVATVGTLLLVLSHASTPSASINANQGSLTYPAVIKSDASASDGNSVMFGSPISSNEGSLLFDGNFESGTINPNQWTNQSCSYGATVVPTSSLIPARAGNYALRFIVSDADTTANTNGQCANVPNTGNPRAQLVSTPLFNNGDTDYVAFSLFLPTNFPTNVPSNAFQIAELYGAPYGGGPIVGMFISGDHVTLGVSYKDSSGTLIYYHPWTSTTPNPIGTAWQDFTLKVHFSTQTLTANNTNGGYVQLWYDGVLQNLTDNNGNISSILPLATLVPGVNWGTTCAINGPGTTNCMNHLYLNSYRKKGDIIPAVTTYEDEAKVGSSYDSVQPVTPYKTLTIQ
jgi:hypothetical protein